MGFIDRNNVIEKLAATTTYPPFAESILPRRLASRQLYFQARRFQEIRNSSIKLRVVVENDITAAQGVRESLPELLQGPLRGGVPSHVEVQDSASPMVDDKQAIEKLERNGWDCKEIECDDHLAMVLEEGQPVLRRIPTPG